MPLFPTHMNVAHDMHNTHNTHGTQTTYAVPLLWAAVAVLALPDALLAPDAHGPVAVAVNVFIFFAALLILTHIYRDLTYPNHYTLIVPQSHAPPGTAMITIYTPPKNETNNTNNTNNPHEHDASICCLRNRTQTLNELTHLFIHVLCLAYVRTACWFEFRALAASLHAAATAVQKLPLPIHL